LPPLKFQPSYIKYRERTPEIHQQSEERCVFKNNLNATSHYAFSPTKTCNTKWYTVDNFDTGIELNEARSPAGRNVGKPHGIASQQTSESSIFCAEQNILHPAGRYSEFRALSWPDVTCHSSVYGDVSIVGHDTIHRFGEAYFRHIHG